MPTYRIETDQGTFDIEADREPTAAEVMAHLGGNGGSPSGGDSDIKDYLRAKGPPKDQEAPLQRTASVNEPGTREKALEAGVGKIGPAALRYAVPLFGAMGGPAGGAITAGGETGAQLAEQGRVYDPGAVAKAGVVGAIPLSQVRGIIGALKNAGRMGAGVAAGTEAQSLVNEGKLADGAQVAKDATIGAAVPLGAAGIGRLVGKITGRVDPADAAKMAALEKDNALEDRTLAAMQDRGAVIPPSNVNDSKANKLLESIAGPTNLENAASKKNAKVFNSVARDEASMPQGSMDREAFKAAREDIGVPYDEVRKLGLGAKVDQWREANNLTQKYYKELSGNYTVAADKAAQEQASRADQLFAELQADTTKAGRPDLADAMQEARVKFAKNYDVEQATNAGNGNVNARVISGLRKARGDEGLTGGLNDIAKFNDAFPDASKPTAGLPTSPSAVTAGTSLLAAGSGGGAAVAALKGGVPFLRGPIRDAILSEPYQRMMASRSYKPGTSADPEVIARIIREMEMAGISRKKKDDKK